MTVIGGGETLHHFLLLMITITEHVELSLPVAGTLLFDTLVMPGRNEVYADQALANDGPVPSNVPINAAAEVDQAAQYMLPNRLIVKEWRWFTIHESM